MFGIGNNFVIDDEAIANAESVNAIRYMYTFLHFSFKIAQDVIRIRSSCKASLFHYLVFFSLLSTIHVLQIFET